MTEIAAITSPSTADRALRPLVLLVTVVVSLVLVLAPNAGPGLVPESTTPTGTAVAAMGEAPSTGR